MSFRRTADLRSLRRITSITRCISKRKRSSTGCSGPDATWFTGDSIDFVRDKLLSDSARIYDILDKKPIQTLVRQHLDGEQNRRLLIWSLLNVESFLGQYSHG